MPCSDHAILLKATAQHSTAQHDPLSTACCAVALRRTALSEHGMANVNQTRPHCVNQMGKTHSNPLATRHAMCESAFSVLGCDTAQSGGNLSKFLTTVVPRVFYYEKRGIKYLRHVGKVLPEYPASYLRSRHSVCSPTRSGICTVTRL